MPDVPIPRTILEYVSQEIDKLPAAARLVVVFDPYSSLDLEARFISERAGRIWRVLRYDGNDLAFRRLWSAGPSTNDLIWVTCLPNANSPRIDLHSMMDVWRRAETFIDASLLGVLRNLAPTETWPAEPVWELAHILGQDLPTVINGLKVLRRVIGKRAALDEHAVRAIALHCIQPDISIDRLLLHADTPGKVLDTYLALLWGANWNEQGLGLLQIQARRASRLDLQEIETWLDVPASTLALYVYLRRVLGQYHVPGIANQLRGLGLIDLNTEAMEIHVSSAMERWDRVSSWRDLIIRQAEHALEQQAISLSRLVGLLDVQTPDAAMEALNRADTPALIYALQVEFLRRALANHQLDRYGANWMEHRPATLRQFPETPYSARAAELTALLDEIAFVDTRSRLSPPANLDITLLLDWYVAQRIYDLEYASVRATTRLPMIADERLRGALKDYLNRQRQDVNRYLDNLDHTLARYIANDWRGYLGHRRLAINVVPDAIRKVGRATSRARLWVVVFDGMRWDTWANHVKPLLLEHFELVSSEQPYLSLLPSWTMVARTGLLAGAPPSLWTDYDNRFTNNQEQLAAKMFKLSKSDYRNQLQFYSGMESDRKTDQVQSGYPYNVLVFNISDDNLHSQKGSLVELNKVVKTLLDNILRTINDFVGPDDTLVVSSDHGFVELDKDDAVTVERDPQVVRYRYLLTHDVPADVADVYKVAYTGRIEQYTVAVGRHWFKRADSRGSDDRYAHGGLSLAEMTVPGAVMRRITVKRLKAHVSVSSAMFQLTEDESADLIVTVANQGNVRLSGTLTVRTEPTGETTTYPIDLLPGADSHFPYRVTARYQQRGKGAVEATKGVNATVSYTELNGKPAKRSEYIEITVKPRTDRVELDFGDLPDFEDM